MVGRARFELAVSWSQTRRFSELSYRPVSSAVRSCASGDGLRTRANSSQKLSPFPSAGNRQHRSRAPNAQDRPGAADAENRARAPNAENRTGAADGKQRDDAEKARQAEEAVSAERAPGASPAAPTRKVGDGPPAATHRRQKCDDHVAIQSDKRCSAPDSSRARAAAARWLYLRFSSGGISPKVLPVPGTRKMGS